MQTKAIRLDTETSTQQRILDAAIQLAFTDGVRSLTQPRVAKAAGVRQSHLTYYFPRKADLLAAVLEASHCYGRVTPPKSLDQAIRFLEELMFDANRMRFLLGAVIEAGNDDNLRTALAAHVDGLAKEVAPHFGRAANDPTVLAFLDRLRGLGIRLLLEPENPAAPHLDVRAVAVEMGLLKDLSPSLKLTQAIRAGEPPQRPAMGRGPGASPLRSHSRPGDKRGDE
jgi:AcrR family transcriptional regulator